MHSRCHAAGSLRKQDGSKGGADTWQGGLTGSWMRSIDVRRYFFHSLSVSMHMHVARVDAGVWRAAYGVRRV